MTCYHTPWEYTLSRKRYGTHLATPGDNGDHLVATRSGYTTGQNVHPIMTGSTWSVPPPKLNSEAIRSFKTPSLHQAVKSRKRFGLTPHSPPSQIPQRHTPNHSTFEPRLKLYTSTVRRSTLLHKSCTKYLPKILKRCGFP